MADGACEVALVSAWIARNEGKASLYGLGPRDGSVLPSGPLPRLSDKTALVADLHRFLDVAYAGDDELRALLTGADVTASDARGETPLHVAARRRRPAAVRILIEHGADANARNAGGKTARVHALRRAFHDIVLLLADDAELTDADRLAVALQAHRLDEARAILAANPCAACTGNPEEDRLLADLAGWLDTTRVKLLIDAGADLAAPGLDGGTALHCAAWFGSPGNARLLIEAGAPLEIFDATHRSTPLGWAVHGSRYSGGCEDNQDAYVEIVRMLLAAGASTHDGEYLRRLRNDASQRVLALLP